MNKEQIIMALAGISAEVLAERIALSRREDLLNPQIKDVKVVDEEAFKKWLLNHFPGPFVIKDWEFQPATKTLKWRFYSLKEVFRPKGHTCYVLFRKDYSEVAGGTITKYGETIVCDAPYFIKEEYAQDNSTSLTDDIPGIEIEWI